MKIVGIDPSSKRTGYAVLDERGRLFEAGYFKPDKPAGDPIDRCLQMGDDLRAFVQGEKPDAVIFEVSSGHVARRLGGRASGQSTYGTAVGAMLYAAATALDELGKLHWVRENVWTGGRPKRKRQAALAVEYAQYHNVFAKDTGGDVADAIGVTLWWNNEQRLKGLIHG